MMKKSPRKLLCKHLKCSGISQSAAITDFFERCRINNGLKFALDLMSNISDAIKQSLKTGEYTIPKGLKVRRVMPTHGKRIKICGHDWLHKLLKLAVAVHQNNERLDSIRMKLLLSVINMKHVYIFDTVQKHHIEKFNNAVNGPAPVSIPKVSLPSDYFLVKVSKKQKPKYHSLYSFPRNEKRYPIYNDDFPNDGKYIISAPSTDPRSADVFPIVALLATNGHDAGKAFLKKLLPHLLHYHDNLSTNYLVGRFLRVCRTLGYDSRVVIPLRGKISHLMETGGKDRAICQPFFAYQIMLEPLKEILANICKSDPNVFTFDQEEGVKFARMLLHSKQQDQKIYCFDASSFTDRFPLSYQLEVLKYLEQPGWAALLELFMDGVFYDPSQKDYIRYAFGQGMGSGPSFHLATASHSILIKSIFNDVHGHYALDTDIGMMPYGVVGDDVFILDEEVANRYQKIMEGMNVEINMTKSVISETFGEFCGVMFNKHSQTIPYKPKDFRFDYERLSKAVKFYGKGYLRNLPSKFSKHRYIVSNKLLSMGGFLSDVPVEYLIERYLRKLHDLSSSIRTRTHTVSHPENLMKFTENALKYNGERGILFPSHRLRSAFEADGGVFRPTLFREVRASHGSLDIPNGTAVNLMKVFDWNEIIEVLEDLSSYNDLISEGAFDSKLDALYFLNDVICQANYVLKKFDMDGIDLPSNLTAPDAKDRLKAEYRLAKENRALLNSSKEGSKAQVKLTEDTIVSTVRIKHNL